jgi:hypothetical protein
MLMDDDGETGAIILKIAYGYDNNPDGPDPLVALANETVENFSVAGTPGLWIVDTLPFCSLLLALTFYNKASN